MKKFKINLVNIDKICLLFSLPNFLIFNLVNCSSNTHTIQLANFESYMSDDLIDYLHQNYNIQFPYFTTNEVIESKFENFYDIAIPSGYEVISLLRRGWLDKIDWEKFDLSKEREEIFQMNGINQMNNQFTKYIKSLPKNDGIFNTLSYYDCQKDEYSFNILDYGIPYFEQSFLFAYCGKDDMTFYKPNGTVINKDDLENELTWDDLFYTISQSNPNLDIRCNPKYSHKMQLVEDTKTIYGVARLIETSTKKYKYDEPTNEISENASINDMVKTLDYITRYYEKYTSSFVLNTDSGLISSSLANPNGCNAALTWTGDMIYACMGAGEYDSFSENDFHIQKINNCSLNEIDFLVINNKNHSSNKIDDIYKIIKTIALEGYDASEEEIINYDYEEDRFKYWPVANFEKICYIPLLKNLYKVVTNPNGGFWEIEKIDEWLATMFADVLKESSENGDKKQYHFFEQVNSILQNSNLHYAWHEAKEKL